jgi:hypothetical protein
MSRRSTVLPKFAERRSTPTTSVRSVLNDRATTEWHMPIVPQEPPLRFQGDGSFSRSDFAYDPEGNVYV